MLDWGIFVINSKAFVVHLNETHLDRVVYEVSLLCTLLSFPFMIVIFNILK